MESELYCLARRCIWWLPPEQALADRTRFLCQVMQLGTELGVRALRAMFGDDAFRAALRAAPPGILDARSWNFWHLNLFGTQPPAQPTRVLPA